MKYLIDESTLLEIAHYLSTRPYEEVAPLIMKLTQGLTSVELEQAKDELSKPINVTNNDE